MSGRERESQFLVFSAFLLFFHLVASLEIQLGEGELPDAEDLYPTEPCSLNIAISRDQYEDICPIRELANFRKQLNDVKRKLLNDSDDIVARCAALAHREALAREKAEEEIDTLKKKMSQLIVELSELRRLVHERSSSSSSPSSSSFFSPSPISPIPSPSTPSPSSQPSSSQVSDTDARVKSMHENHAASRKGSTKRAGPITTVTKSTDCRGVRRAGVYVIHPSTSADPFPVLCQDGWTYLARRWSGQVNFLRNWEDYKNGFGNLTSEFHLGNEKIHKLTTQSKYRLRIDISAYNRSRGHASYDTFWLGDSTDLYRLHIGGHSGSLDNCMYRQEQDSPFNHNEMPFSTYDQDNDKSDSANCAQVYGSGNWFNDCYSSNIFGPWCGANENHSKCAVWWDHEGRLIIRELALRIREIRGKK